MHHAVKSSVQDGGWSMLPFGNTFYRLCMNTITHAQSANTHQAADSLVRTSGPSDPGSHGDRVSTECVSETVERSSMCAEGLSREEKKGGRGLEGPARSSMRSSFHDTEAVALWTSGVCALCFPSRGHIGELGERNEAAVEKLGGRHGACAGSRCFGPPGGKRHGDTWPGEDRRAHRQSVRRFAFWSGHCHQPTVGLRVWISVPSSVQWQWW